MGKFRVFAAGLAAACFLTSMAGCTAANRTPQGVTPNGTLTRQGTNLSRNLTIGTNPNAMMPGTTVMPGTLVTPGTAGNGRQNMRPAAFDVARAEHIVKNMGHIDGSRNVKAIVNGNTALVGYTPSGTMRNTLATKSAIVKKVKTLDRNITNVFVSESSDVMNGIHKLSNDIRGNKLGTDLNNSFTQLLKKVKGG